MADGYAVRCSVLVFRDHQVLLVHRTHDGLDDWVLPGGTPREGESLTACARRELLEETGLAANPSDIVAVAESSLTSTSDRVLDIVFRAAEPVVGQARGHEPGLEPVFVPPGQLAHLTLHPPLAAHLDRLSEPGSHGFARYVGNTRHP